ncbi:MAG: hypothetical protein V7L04_12490 [Nostoc sp.]|uniref:DUF6972 family protein n=1 Tax=Nostoc sp. TaxID=1180 RepID=UPI002FF78EB2
MSGIDRNITPDRRPSLVDSHLPNTPQVQRLRQREGRAHVFSDRETLERVTQAIISKGNFWQKKSCKSI